MFVPHEFTEYEFVMQWSSPGGERRWVVRRRFREFSALDKSLDESLPESVQLPQFPKKAAFGRMSPSLVRTRRMALEQVRVPAWGGRAVRGAGGKKVYAHACAWFRGPAAMILHAHTVRARVAGEVEGQRGGGRKGEGEGQSDRRMFRCRALSGAHEPRLCP